MTTLRLIYASAIAAIYSIWFIVAITVLGELNPGFKDFLKSLTGHHWVTKGYAMLLFYGLALLICYDAAKKPSEVRAAKTLRLLSISAGLGLVALVGFFIWHF
ncbi:MAG: hypothetical protein HY545_00820 [Candidatus Doudnabacteria bacterium]|nr:hypothetical protein [Candidatus Doudnabacteria bacterium]